MPSTRIWSARLTWSDWAGLEIDFAISIKTTGLMPACKCPGPAKDITNDKNIDSKAGTYIGKSEGSIELVIALSFVRHCQWAALTGFKKQKWI